MSTSIEKLNFMLEDNRLSLASLIKIRLALEIKRLSLEIREQLNKVVFGQVIYLIFLRENYILPPSTITTFSIPPPNFQDA
jgi:hypothetical protein